MAKVIAVNRGATGQTHIAYLVHPDRFNYDEEGNPVSVKLAEVPTETQVNNGQGIAFYLVKGFIDPQQFLDYSDYKSFKAKNKKAAKEFEDTALEDEAKAKARDKEEEEERLASRSADELRHLDKKTAPGNITKSGQGVG